jgi:antitoxin HicB
MSHGDTVEQAAHNIHEAAKGWLDMAVRDGDPIAAPPQLMSGKLVLRMPKDLHADVAERAARQGVSINTWILAAVARASG